VACFEKATEKCIDGLKLEIFHPKKNVLDGTGFDLELRKYLFEKE
jgi:hypothetical protein